MGYATLFLETLEIIKVNYTHCINFRKYRHDAHCWHFDVYVLVIRINNLKFPRCWKSGGTARPSLLWEWLKFHWPPLFEYWGPFGIPFLYFSLFPMSLRYFWSPHQKGGIAAVKYECRNDSHGHFHFKPIWLLLILERGWPGLVKGCCTSGCLSCSSVLQGKMWATWWWNSPFAGPFHSFPETRAWEGEEDRDLSYLLCLSFTVFMAPAQAGQAHCGPSRLEWPSPWALVWPRPLHAILAVHRASWFPDLQLFHHLLFSHSCSLSYATK